MREYFDIPFEALHDFRARIELLDRMGYDAKAIQPTIDRMSERFGIKIEYDFKENVWELVSDDSRIRERISPEMNLKGFLERLPPENGIKFNQVYAENPPIPERQLRIAEEKIPESTLNVENNVPQVNQANPETNPNVSAETKSKWGKGMKKLGRLLFKGAVYGGLGWAVLAGMARARSGCWLVDTTTGAKLKKVSTAGESHKNNCKCGATDLINHLEACKQYACPSDPPKSCDEKIPTFCNCPKKEERYQFQYIEVSVSEVLGDIAAAVGQIIDDSLEIIDASAKGTIQFLKWFPWIAGGGVLLILLLIFIPFIRDAWRKKKPSPSQTTRSSPSTVSTSTSTVGFGKKVKRNRFK